MRRWLVTVFAAAAVLTACGSGDDTMAALREQVASVRESAAAGDRDAAQRSLDELRRLVDAAVERGGLGRNRADAILTAAAEVERELDALAEPPGDERPPAPLAPNRAETEDDKHEHDEDDEDEDDDEEEEDDEDED